MKPKTTMIAAALALAAQSSFAADTYPIDPMHTFPAFEFSHMGISVWRGRFDKTSGTITLDRAAKTGTVDVLVDTASISFGLDIMDAKAKSEDFFNVAKYPTATYKGKIVFSGDKPSAVDGNVTLMGVTKPLKLTVLSFNCIPHPMNKKQELCGADVEGEMNWGEYGMKWSQYGQGDAGKTKLRIQVEGVKQN
ncbi:MAG: YceI family protein [Spongiibacteraceae bacterium]